MARDLVCSWGTGTYLKPLGSLLFVATASVLVMTHCLSMVALASPELRRRARFKRLASGASSPSAGLFALPLPALPLPLPPCCRRCHTTLDNKSGRRASPGCVHSSVAGCKSLLEPYLCSGASGGGRRGACLLRSPLPGGACVRLTGQRLLPAPALLQPCLPWLLRCVSALERP